MKKVFEYQNGVDEPWFYSTAKKAYDAAKKQEPNNVYSYNKYRNLVKNIGVAQFTDETYIVIRYLNIHE